MRQYHLSFEWMADNMLKIIGCILFFFSVLHCEAPEFFQEPKPKNIPISPSSNIVFIATSDYQTGSYSTIDIDSFTAYNDLGPGNIHSNVSVRYFFDKVYIINRLGRDNIQVLEPTHNFQTLREISMGANSNPADIALVNPESAYVTRYNEKELWIINPTTGIKTGEIDLSDYAHSSTDGKPRMSRLYYHEETERLFVQIQRLKSDNRPSEYSSVIVIDTDPVSASYNSVISEIRLEWADVHATNPYSDFRFVPGAWWQPDTADGNDHLFISCVGFFGYWIELDCGIVAIDIQDLVCEQGYILKETDANAEISEFIIKSSDEAYATIRDANFHSKLVKFNPQTGEITKTIRIDNNEHGFLWTLGYHSGSGMLFLCDRNALDPGVRIYDTNNNDLPMNSDSPVYVGLPPFELMFIE